VSDAVAGGRVCGVVADGDEVDGFDEVSALSMERVHLLFGAGFRDD
jgi:hypothetical protein